MKTIKQVTITPVFVEKYIPEIKDMEPGVFYISKEYHTAPHLCLCGCGAQTVTPLNKSGWALTDKDGKVSLQPSISNYQQNCKSHYIITNNVANFI